MNSQEKTKIYLIESGPALDLILAHIKDRHRATAMKVQIMTQLGINPEKYEQVQVWSSSYDGRLSAISIHGKTPKGFDPSQWTKADSKGRRTPKRNTPIHKIFYSAEGAFEPAEQVIIKAFNVPTQIAYSTSTGQGFTSIGRMMASCGFLWLDAEKGPFAMWTPDVVASVADVKAQHARYKSFKVLRGADDWKLDIPGVKPILQEEWDLIVAQKNLEKALEKARAQAIFEALPAAGKKNITRAVKKAASKGDQ